MTCFGAPRPHHPESGSLPGTEKAAQLRRAGSLGPFPPLEKGMLGGRTPGSFYSGPSGGPGGYNKEPLWSKAVAI